MTEFDLTEEERSNVVTDINSILRASGQSYAGYPALGPDATRGWHKIWIALTGREHKDATAYLRSLER